MKVPMSNKKTQKQKRKDDFIKTQHSIRYLLNYRNMFIINLCIYGSCKSEQTFVCNLIPHNLIEMTENNFK